MRIYRSFVLEFEMYLFDQNHKNGCGPNSAAFRLNFVDLF